MARRTMLLPVTLSACRNTFACLELPDSILNLWTNASMDPTNPMNQDEIMDSAKNAYMCTDNQRCKDFGDYFSNVMGPPPITPCNSLITYDTFT